MHWKKTARSAASLTAAMLVAALAACSSCATSSTALRAHSHVAQTLDDVGVQARTVVLELRQGKIDDAIASAQQSNADPVLAAHRAGADFDAGPWLPAFNGYVAAKDAYVRAVLLAAQVDKPDWDTARPALNDVVLAYGNLRTATGDKLPPIPEVVLKLLREE